MESLLCIFLARLIVSIPKIGNFFKNSKITEKSIHQKQNDNRKMYTKL